MISYAYAIIVAKVHARKYENIITGKMLMYWIIGRGRKKQQQRDGTMYSSYAYVYTRICVRAILYIAATST